MKFATILCMLGATEALKMKIRSTIRSEADSALEAAGYAQKATGSYASGGSYSYDPVWSYGGVYVTSYGGKNVVMSQSGAGNEDTGENSSKNVNIDPSTGAWSFNDRESRKVKGISH